MPVQDSDLIIANVYKAREKQVKARMRNHWIKVYAASKDPELGLPSNLSRTCVAIARRLHFTRSRSSLELDDGVTSFLSATRNVRIICVRVVELPQSKLASGEWK
jgi:hypothetical protein